MTPIASVPTHGEKLEKFNGAEVKRWQQKMLFYLTTLNLARFLMEDAPKLDEGETNEEKIDAIDLQASCSKDKAVLISVYVEKPQRRKLSSPNPSHRPHHHRHHYHHHHHHHLHRPNEERQIQSKGTFSGKGYNRRAELLHYCQHLRKSAHPAAESTSLLPAPISTNNYRISDKTVAVQRKQKLETAPACLGNYKITITRFLRSLTSFQAKKDRKKRKKDTGGSTGNKEQAEMKSLEVKSSCFLVSSVRGFSTG
ncbi:uncharacterized protein LOC130140071 [Syzygium oleosum]|uniref:uncharacterized protein LOC130140071 n=1 Tax=Syzygium oleosum TaxID=219896 RepID=UPI0024BA3BD8|nr:uncharacterized protein LOC130140071 [Syzygium oleosum]